MKLIAVVALSAALGGCSAGVKYVVDNYGAVQKVDFRAMPPDGPQFVEAATGEKVDRSRVFWIFDNWIRWRGRRVDGCGASDP